MTIFLDIAKIFLVEVVNEERVRADSVNSSYIGSKSRDLAHSQTKLDLLDKLKVEIVQFRDWENDAATWVALKRLIAKYQKRNKDLCDNHKQLEQTTNQLASKRLSYSKPEPAQEPEREPYAEGEFRTAMIKANSLLDGIFLHVIEVHNLANIRPEFHPDESIDFNEKVSPSLKYLDAFDKARYYYAYYFVQRYKEPDEQSLIRSYMSSLSFTSVVRVGAEKSEMLKETMVILEKALENSDKDRLQQRDNRRAIILLALKTILGGNITLCQNYSLQPEMPISAIGFGSFVVKLPSWEPASGRLKDAMEKAYREVVSMPPLPKQLAERKKVEQSPPVPPQPGPNVPLDEGAGGSVGVSVVQRGTMFGAQATVDLPNSNANPQTMDLALHQ